MHIRTPTIHSGPLSSAANRPVWLKLEALQPTGSFKLREGVKVQALEPAVVPAK